MYGCDSEDNPHTPSPLKQKHDVQFLIITCLGFLLQLHYKLVKSSLGMLIIRKMKAIGQSVLPTITGVNLWIQGLVLLRRFRVTVNKLWYLTETSSYALSL